MEGDARDGFAKCGIPEVTVVMLSSTHEGAVVRLWLDEEGDREESVVGVVCFPNRKCEAPGKVLFDE